MERALDWQSGDLGAKPGSAPHLPCVPGQVICHFPLGIQLLHLQKETETIYSQDPFCSKVEVYKFQKDKQKAPA